jgi:hypothetical protein
MSTSSGADGERTGTERREEPRDGSVTPPSFLPAGETVRPQKLPKPPKPRKVEKRQRGRKG